MSDDRLVHMDPSSTHFIARHHDGPEPTEAYGDTDGQCCFCGHDGPGQPASEVINYKYFNDDPLMHSSTGHVCASCAYCMQEARGIKIGHWIATPNRYERISTGDLLETFQAIRDGAYEPPLAVYVAKRANISQHSYLWTSLSATADPLTITYARQETTTAIDELFDVVAAVEDLRFHGFRLEDIRLGRPRVSGLRSIGRETYRRLDAVLEPVRETPLLEIALTVSRAQSDQPRDDTSEHPLRTTELPKLA